MKNRAMLFIGLTTLLGGCDENKEEVLAVCAMGGVKVQAVYHQVRGGDYLSLDFWGNPSYALDLKLGSNEDQTHIRAQNLYP